MSKILLSIITAVAIVLPVSKGWTQVLPCDQEIVPSDISDELTRFGLAVAISGNVAVVGAKGANQNGQAYVYRFDGTTWNEEQILIASDSASIIDFGISVAIDGEVIAIGARIPSAVDATYMFRYDGTSWIEEEKIVCPVDQFNSQFGRSIALVGNQLLVGASGVEVAGMPFLTGAAYLFEFDGNSWTLEHSFSAEEPTDADKFGQTVDFEPATGTIVIGDPGGSSATVFYCGALHVYEQVGSTWNFAQKIVADDASTGASFGSSVSLSGNHIIVGAPLDDEIDMLHGAAYAFERTGGSWSQQEKFLIPGINIQIGASVSLAGNTAIIGTTSAYPSPKAMIYELQGGEWELEKVLIGQGNRNFGRIVYIDDDQIILGMPEDFSTGNDNKSAKIFTRENNEWVFFGFVSQLSDTTACPGDPLMMSVEADGVEPLTYQWQRDGVDILGQTSATLVIDPMTTDDLATFSVVITSPCGSMTSQEAEVTCAPFIRGDVNGNGVVEPIGDAISFLQFLLSPGTPPLPCEATADVDGSHSINIADPIYLLNFGFVGGPMPPPPYPNCGHDPLYPFIIPCFNPPPCL